MVSSAALAVALTACSTTPTTAGSTTSSTFGAGSPWSGGFHAVALPSPVNSLRSVACASATRCWAVGATVGVAGAPNGAALIATTDGGATWAGQTIPPTMAYLSAISCSGQRLCTAVGQLATGQGGVIVTTSGGTTWSQEPVPAGILDLTAVTCRPDRRCLAVGTTVGTAVVLSSTAPGGAWSQLGSLPATDSGGTGLSCTTDQDCWVTAHTSVDVDHVAGTVALTSDGGSTWTTVPTPSGIGYLNGISCLAGPVTGSGALPFTSTTVPSAGSPGATPPTPSTTVAPTTTPSTTVAPTTTTAVVGTAGARCTVVGTDATTLDGARSGHGLLFTTDNGGATWSRSHLPSTAAALTGVSCVAIGTCVAVGSFVALAAQAGLILVSGSTGQPWRTSSTVGVPQPLAAVSCVSTTACAAVGESLIERLASN